MKKKESPETIVDRLFYYSQVSGSKDAFVFVEDKKDLPFSQQRISYAELALAVQILAERISNKVAAGNRVVLSYPPGLDFVIAFYACLYAEVVAVPVHPPHNSLSSERLSRVAQDCQAQLFLSNKKLQPLMQKSIERVPGSCLDQLMLTDNLNLSAAKLAPVKKVLIRDKNRLAFLQYTSGSTGSPKGVMITHGNIIANLRSLEEATGCNEQDVFVNWLPLYHDLGLINTVLLPISIGSQSILLAPLQFIQRPRFWFEAITHFKGSICGAPNFAFDICINKIKENDFHQLNLSSWRIAFNAAEAINANSLTQFSSQFSKIGFDENALYPSYGMAEATVFLTGGSPTALPIVKAFDKYKLAADKVFLTDKQENVKHLVACGKSTSHHQLKIVDPESCCELSDNNIGEVWVSGPSIALGYWENIEATEQNFHCALVGYEENFFRTGDLGFVHDNELYITGRIKELIIIRGQNFYPADIERALQNAHPALQLHGGAAFSIQIDGHEQLVIVQEIQRTALKNLHAIDIYEKINSTLGEQFELNAYEIVLIKPGSLPKTYSGKVQRNKCKEIFFQGFPHEIGRYSYSVRDLAVDQSPPETYEQIQLVEIFSEILEIETIGIHNNFFSLGANSIGLTRALVAIQNNFHINLTVEDLFNYPTVEKLSIFISENFKNIYDKSNQIVDFKSYKKNIEHNKGDYHPLSFSQQRMLFMSSLDGASDVFNIPITFTIRGALNEDALRLSLCEIINRHEVLRTRFVIVDQLSAAVIDDFIPLNLDVCKINRDLLNKSCIEAAAEQFDIDGGYLLRTKLFSVQDDEHVLLVTMHHSIIDGWSLAVFVREFTVLYSAFSRGDDSPLSPLGWKYTDYVRWQHQNFSNEGLEPHLKYFKSQLENIPALHGLLTDFPRPAVKTFNGGVVKFNIPNVLTERLRIFSYQQNVTLFMSLFAAFSVLLSRYSGQTDIVIGAPVANRNFSFSEDMMGLFVNTLVLRNNLSTALSFTELVQQTRQMILQSMVYQDLPFDKLVEHLQPHRSASYLPLFEVMFVLQNMPILKQLDSDIVVSRLDLDIQSTQFDLMLDLIEGQGGLVGGFSYNTDLFKRSTVERMANHFLLLLESLVNAPEVNIFKAAMLSQAEQHQLLVEWNNTAVDYPKDKCIHELFEAQVERNPNAVAVIFEDQQLSYGELNRKANQLAHYLIQERGVKPDTLVGICVERSLEMVIGILGILKAGGAYVPLDPEYPEARLKYMLTDAVLGTVITQDNLRERVQLDDSQAVSLDSVAVQEQSSVNPVASQQGLTSSHLAYVIYTSGSTGNPKGVMIEHKSTSAFLSWARATYDSEQLSCVLASTSICFDLSVFELFAPLSSGCSVLILENIFELSKCKYSENITLINTVPSAAEILLSESLIPKSVKTINLAGEPLKQKIVDRLYLSGVATVYDLYGPSEDTTYSTFVLRCLNGVGSIGKPIHNCQVYVLDQTGELACNGNAGELYIGGAGLARGYLNRPDLTTEKFVPNRFYNKTNPSSSDRLYKTGDLVRWLPDGNLEFLGRIDHQVKLRGFRIELGEIENVLSAHVGVVDAVALVKNDDCGDSQLKAYVIPSNNYTDINDHLYIKRISEVFEGVYQTVSSAHSDDAYVGWSSSYDYEPIPVCEMQEWCVATVDRILKLRPKRILEIGIGSGLLFWKLVPHCESYWGTDVSKTTLNRLNSMLITHPELEGCVELRQQEAIDFSGLPANFFDMVVINSVVQYFSNADYLTNVLNQAVKLVVPNGNVFVGDVRNLQTFTVFQTAVQVSHAFSEQKSSSLRRKIDTAISMEKELLLSPDFFINFANKIENIVGVNLQVKTHRFDNEITRHRYDVVLHVEPTSMVFADHFEKLLWAKDINTLEDIKQKLSNKSSLGFRVSNIPNWRLESELDVCSKLDADIDIGELKSFLEKKSFQEFTFDVFNKIAAEYGYEILATWSAGSFSGELDLVFVDELTVIQSYGKITNIYMPMKNDIGLSKYFANDPQIAFRRVELISSLRMYLQASLPKYMVPSTIEVWNSWPLTPNGKLDRKTLLDSNVIAEHVKYVAPQNDTERILCEIWQEKLSVARISITDNFFQIGGNSLLAARLIIQVNKVFNINLSLQELFQTQTIELLARSINESQIVSNLRLNKNESLLLNEVEIKI